QAQQVNNAEFVRLINETGCESKYNDDKKEYLFRTNYLNKEMTVSGEFKNSDKGDIYLKLLPSTLTYDIVVKLRNPQAAFDIKRGQRVAVTFQVKRQGGCILGFRGDNGVIR